MPIAEIAAEDACNLAALMSPDLAAELRRQQVSEPLLSTLSQAGFRTVRKFQMIAHSEQNLEEVATMFGLDRKVMADFSDILFSESCMGLSQSLPAKGRRSKGRD